MPVPGRRGPLALQSCQPITRLALRGPPGGRSLGRTRGLARAAQSPFRMEVLDLELLALLEAEEG